MRPDIRKLSRAIGATLRYREFGDAQPLPARTLPRLLALVSFERDLGRTWLAARLVPAFARRGIAAVACTTPPGVSRAEVIVVDVQGPPPAALVAAADAVVLLVSPSVERVREAEAQLPPAYRSGAARVLVCRYDAGRDLRALTQIRALCGPRLLSTTLHEDPAFDAARSQTVADVSALARELGARSAAR